VFVYFIGNKKFILLLNRAGYMF